MNTAENHSCPLSFLEQENASFLNQSPADCSEKEFALRVGLPLFRDYVDSRLSSFGARYKNLSALTHRLRTWASPVGDDFLNDSLSRVDSKADRLLLMHANVLNRLGSENSPSALASCFRLVSDSFLPLFSGNGKLTQAEAFSRFVFYASAFEFIQVLKESDAKLYETFQRSYMRTALRISQDVSQFPGFASVSPFGTMRLCTWTARFSCLKSTLSGLGSSGLEAFGEYLSSAHQVICASDGFFFESDGEFVLPAPDAFTLSKLRLNERSFWSDDPRVHLCSVLSASRD